MTLAHSKLGASSMYRWAACPGSVKLSEDCPKTASAYAEEGSDAHALASYALRQKMLTTKSFVGRRVHMEDRTFEVTDDMVEAVDVYLRHLADTFEPGDEDMIEHRFDLSAIYPGCFGTADHVRWRPSQKLLIVTDYKHGAGIFVSAMNNPQLRYYALGALTTLAYPAARVRMEIVQPRCDSNDGGTRYEEIDALELIDFSADLVTYAKRTEAPNAPCVPGDHCRFCPAASQPGKCKALEDQSRAVAKMEFLPLQAYDPETLANALDMLPALEGKIKAIREFAYEEAEAGRCPPRHKLVAKRATRRWRDQDAVKAHLVKLLPSRRDEIFEPVSLKSPAQMEKIKGVKKGTLAEFIIAESSGHVLAPQDDPRPAIVKTLARDEFKAIAPPTN